VTAISKLAIAVLLLILLSVPGRCALLYIFDAPQDVQKLRESIRKRADVQRLTEEYNTVERAYLWYLRSNELPATFGTKMKDFPRSCILPAFEQEIVAVSGLTDMSKPDKRHTDVYAVGSIGYIEFIFGQDGQRMETTVICFRPDATFVPLTSKTSILKRLEWEKQKWQFAQAWLKARLVKDLRQDEVFDPDVPQRKSRTLRLDIRKMWRVVPFPRKDFFVPPVSSIHAAERVFNTLKLQGMTRHAVAERLHTELRSQRYNYNAPFWRIDADGQPYPKGAQVFKFDAGGFGLQFTIIYGPDGKVNKVQKQWIFET
jgi:hypothetical protein